MDCPCMAEVSYAEFGKQLNSRANSERIPVCGSVELTFRCNLRCVHCYCNHDNRKKEMSFKESCNILDAVAQAGCLWLLITGGEPLLRDDFLDIYTYAKKKGMIITLFTNGTLLTPYIAGYLKEYPPFMIEISLYGATAGTYEKVTGISGSYQRCLRGINLLRERNLPLRLKTMAMTLNQDEVLDMEKFAQRLGLEFRFDAAINPKLSGSKEPNAFRIPPEKIIELDLASQKRTAEWEKFCQEFWGPADSDKLYVCGGGISSFNIDPYGNVSICAMARDPAFSLRHASFMEYWHNSIPQALSQKPQGNYQCGSCSLISLCGQCPGWARLEHGNPQEPVEYLCRIAQLRAQAFGREKKSKRLD